MYSIKTPTPCATSDFAKQRLIKTCISCATVGISHRASLKKNICVGWHPPWDTVRLNGWGLVAEDLILAHDTSHGLWNLFLFFFSLFSLFKSLFFSFLRFSSLSYLSSWQQSPFSTHHAHMKHIFEKLWQLQTTLCILLPCISTRKQPKICSQNFKLLLVLLLRVMTFVETRPTDRLTRRNELQCLST